jgi:hypothetical protein
VIRRSEIEAAARLLIARRGPSVRSYAEGRAQSLVEMGDLHSQAVWKRIAKAISVLESGQPPEDRLIG